MEKLDYKKEYKSYYNPSPKIPEILEIPDFKFLMIDGTGMKESFQNAIQALFGVSFKAKFVMKKEQGLDYVVMPLEGLWWADDMDDFMSGNKEKWNWTLMIMQPDFVTPEIIQASIQEAKKGESRDALDLLRLENYAEGLSAQILHVGSFSEEHPNIMRIHELIAENGGKFDGKRQKHHEIYLSDFRKTAPEKLRTVLRQPFGR
jgi:hypothetical protein